MGKGGVGMTNQLPTATTEGIVNPEMENIKAVTNPLLEAATYWADMGVKVFALRKYLKKPATDHGYKDGTTDLTKIDQWFRHSTPHYNLGLCCGNGLQGNRLNNRLT